jgi:hypothetical protein
MVNIFECKDILQYTKSFMNNNEIIELILCSKKINKMIGKSDTFTSITIYDDKNICDIIRLYLNHKKSIYKTILIKLKEPFILWPFSSYYMIFIDCGNLNNSNIESVYNNYKDAKKITIKNTIRPRFWH